MGYKHQGYSGFGLAKPFLVPPKGSQAYMKFISDLSEEIDGEESLAKTVQLHLQGNWTRWCDYIKIIADNAKSLVSFCIQAAYDLLPCPSNLVRWKLSNDSRCFFVQKTVF